MDRPHVRLTPAQAPWLSDPGAQKVCRLIADAGYQILFVGGCVRNAVLGAPTSDIDLSTDARPERVLGLAEDAGLKAIPTGITHGTVTIVIDGTPYEVTTFRRDVATDGRRAVVAFADDVAEDAMRRDFTMNALYARPDGVIVDPLGGLPDAHARHVRFIGRPEDRIREDYLRILRYFRFYGTYGDPAAGPDPDALAAIAALSDGISTLSAERIGAEMFKILAIPDPSTALAAMQHSGVLGRVIPGADLTILFPLIALEDAPDVIRRLAAIGGEGVADRLRLSRSDARAFDTLREAMGQNTPVEILGYRHGRAVATSIALLNAAIANQKPPADLQERIEFGADQIFPVAASDLPDGFTGKAIGEKLRALESQWLTSGMTLTKAELLG